MQKIQHSMSEKLGSKHGKRYGHWNGAKIFLGQSWKAHEMKGTNWQQKTPQNNSKGNNHQSEPAECEKIFEMYALNSSLTPMIFKEQQRNMASRSMKMDAKHL